MSPAITDRLDRDRAFLSAYRRLPLPDRAALCRLAARPGHDGSMRDRVARFAIEIGFEPAAALAEAEAVLS